MTIDDNRTKLEKKDIRARFDQVLGKHLERLIGTRYGIGGLPLEIITTCSLFLLVDREKEIEASPSSPPERYTEETLLSDLAESGLDSGEDLEGIIQNMIQQEYIDESPQGLFFATKPTFSMGQLLEQVFPEIPGMHLVAYFVQTMEEVLSGRKELEPAASQFDQTLQMQGIPLTAMKSQFAADPGTEQLGERQISRASAKANTIPPKSRHPQRRGELGKSSLLSSVRREADSRPASGPKILSSRGQAKSYEIRESVSTTGESPGTTPGNGQESELLKPGTPRTAAETERAAERPESDPVTSAETADPPVNFKTTEGIEPDTVEEGHFNDHDLFGKTALDEGAEPTIPVEEPGVEPPASVTDEIEAVSTKQEQSLAEDIIKHRIEAFEEDLAMACPACGAGKVQSEQTSTGKNFYVCANAKCNFISWGKPHHVICPRCENPFLVEVKDNVLKCPRATCGYLQEVPGHGAEVLGRDISRTQEAQKTVGSAKRPRRRLVRRRVVRRKK